MIDEELESDAEFYDSVAELWLDEDLTSEEREKAVQQRNKVVEKLLEQGEDSAAQQLFRALALDMEGQDDSAEFEDFIGQTLKNIGEPAFKFLFEILESCNENYKADIAAYALGKMGDARAFEPLVKALNTCDGAVYARAAQALGYLGDKRAVSLLTEVLHAEKALPYSARFWAAYGLAHLGALDVIIEALKSPWDEIVVYSLTVLEKFGDSKALLALENLRQTTLNEKRQNQIDNAIHVIREKLDVQK